jgi:hypothetical protein
VCVCVCVEEEGGGGRVAVKRQGSTTHIRWGQKKKKDPTSHSRCTPAPSFFSCVSRPYSLVSTIWRGIGLLAIHLGKCISQPTPPTSAFSLPSPPCTYDGTCFSHDPPPHIVLSILLDVPATFPYTSSCLHASFFFNLQYPAKPLSSHLPCLCV